MFFVANWDWVAIVVRIRPLFPMMNVVLILMLLGLTFCWLILLMMDLLLNALLAMACAASIQQLFPLQLGQFTAHPMARILSSRIPWSIQAHYQIVTFILIDGIGIQQSCQK